MTNQRKEHVRYTSVTIFIPLTVVASQICKIPQNSPNVWIYSSRPRSSILVSIESLYATSYWSI